MFESVGNAVVERHLLTWLRDRRHTRRHRYDDVTFAPGQVEVRDLGGSTSAGDTTAEDTAAEDTAAEDAGLPLLADLAHALEAGAACLDEAVAAHRAVGASTAARFRALATFARQRPAGSFDRAPGEPGAASESSRAARPAALTTVSEWAVDEVAVRLHLTAAAAQALLGTAVTLVEQLPATLAALADGRIGEGHVRALVDWLPLLADPQVRTRVEARLLARVGSKTPPQLREAARRAVLRADASAAAERAARALRERDVRLFPDRDATATLTATLPAPVARACYDALERYAEACAVDEHGARDPRTRKQRMADCLADLILRPGETGLAPVTAQLTVVVPAETLAGGDEPGEVDGDLLPAEVVRELAYALGLLPRPQAQAPAADTEPTEESAAPELAALADLLTAPRPSARGLAERPAIAVVHPLTGALLALTDAAALRAGEPIGPPPEYPGYRPGAALDRFVRARDRRCRFPGCRARPRTCDLDHVCPWLRGGPTAHQNLCCLCEHHHRLTHQAPGWAVHPTADGGLRFTLPGGHAVTTHAPAYGADDDHPITGANAATAGSRPRSPGAPRRGQATRPEAHREPVPDPDPDPPPF